MKDDILQQKQWKQYLYYILVAIISVISLIFLPMIDSSINGGFNFPTTAPGWVIYIIQQMITAIINILIFHSFCCQSELNVRDNEYYQKAKEILRTTHSKEYIPESLEHFRKKEYGIKGVWIFIGSVMATFALTQAILSFDYIRMLTYAFTVAFGIIFGIIEMKKWETFYTTTYYDYALWFQEKKRQEDEEEQKRLQQEREKEIEIEVSKRLALLAEEPSNEADDTLCDLGGDALLVASDPVCLISINN